MTEKRYFKRMWEDEFYIFDSQTISEKEFDEKVEYEDYQAFADSLMGDEVVDRLNELDKENRKLKNELNLSKLNLKEKNEGFDKLHKMYMEQIEENKELKTIKDKVFALIDARIEIYKRKPFMAPVSAPMSVNFDEDTDRLARLSELEQLKKELSESE